MLYAVRQGDADLGTKRAIKFIPYNGLKCVSSFSVIMVFRRLFQIWCVCVCVCWVPFILFRFIPSLSLSFHIFNSYHMQTHLGRHISNTLFQCFVYFCEIVDEFIKSDRFLLRFLLLLYVQIVFLYPKYTRKKTEKPPASLVNEILGKVKHIPHGL